jgi:hypothetical protein
LCIPCTYIFTYITNTNSYTTRNHCTTNFTKHPTYFDVTSHHLQVPYTVYTRTRLRLLQAVNQILRHVIYYNYFRKDNKYNVLRSKNFKQFRTQKKTCYKTEKLFNLFTVWFCALRIIVGTNKYYFLQQPEPTGHSNRDAVYFVGQGHNVSVSVK